MHALLSLASEARWRRRTHVHLRHPFLYLPKQPGYNKRPGKLAATVNWLILVGVVGPGTDVRLLT